MRLMERIRRRGQFWLVLTGAIFAISIFFGLGSYFFSGFGRGAQNQSAAEVGGNLAAKVNGQGITADEFYKQFYESLRMYEQYTRGKIDPLGEIHLMSTLLDTLVEQQVIADWAKSKGIEPSTKEIQDEIAKRVSNAVATAAKPEESGNVFGEFTAKLSASSAASKARQEYLRQLNLTEEQLRAQVRTELTQQKAQDEMVKEGKQNDIDEMKKTKVAEVEKALAGGMSFEDAAKKYSADTKTAQKGGLIPTLIQPQFFDKSFDENVFDAHPAAGTVTKPFKTEFGWQFVKVLEWPKAEGPEFEKAKPGIMKKLTDKHPGDPNYKPTPDDIANEYTRSSVRVEHITLQANTQAGASKIRGDLTDKAKVVIYDPLVLGYRALKGLPDKSPKAVKEAEAKKPEAKPAAGAGNAKTNATPAPAAAPDKTKAAPAAPGAPPLDKGAVAKPGETQPNAASNPAAPAKKKRPPKIDFDPFTQQITVGGEPRYQEAVDYFTQVSKGQGWKGLSYYLIARTYFDWSHDEYSKGDLPLKPAEVQAKIKEALDQTLKLDEYNPFTYILQAGFLKDQGKTDDAAKALALGIKYASGSMDVLSQVQNLAKDLGKQAIADEAGAKIKDIQEQQKKQQEAQKKAIEEQKKAQEEAQKKLEEQKLKKQIEEQAPPPPPITRK